MQLCNYLYTKRANVKMWNIFNFSCTIVHTAVLQKKRKRKNCNNAQFKLMHSTDSTALNSICIFHLKHIIPLLGLDSPLWTAAVYCDLWTCAGLHRSRELASSSRDNQIIMHLWCFFASVTWPQTWICAISKSSSFSSVLKMQSQPASWTGLEISSSSQRIGSPVCVLAQGQPGRIRREGSGF